MNLDDIDPVQLELVPSLFGSIERADAAETQRLLSVDSRIALVPYYDKTALIFAAGSRRVECLKALLPFSDTDAVDPNGFTALHHAASSSCLEAVELLGPLSDVDQKAGNGRTPLMVAVGHFFEAGVRFLAPLSDLSLTDNEGNTALGMAKARELVSGEKAAVLVNLLRSAAARQEGDAIAQAIESDSADAERPSRRARSL